MSYPLEKLVDDMRKSNLFIENIDNQVLGNYNYTFRYKPNGRWFDIVNVKRDGFNREYPDSNKFINLELTADEYDPYYTVIFNIEKDRVNSLEDFLKITELLRY